MSRARFTVLVALASVGWLALLAGCSSEAQSGAQKVAEGCKSGTNMPAEACECLAGLAEERLSPASAMWLGTAMSGDTERALQLKEGIPWTELVEASMFMMNASQDCALELDPDELPSFE